MTDYFETRLGQLSSRGSGVAGGVAWTFALRLSIQLIQLVSLLVTARILSPSDFGAAAIVLSITGLAFFVNEFGVSAAMVASRSLTKSLYGTAPCLNMLTGVILFAALVSLSFVAAPAFGMADLQGLFVLSASGFLLSQSSAPMGVLLRFSHLRRVGLIELTGAVISIITTLSGIYAGLGAAALVIGPLASTLAVSILANAVVRLFPVRHCSVGHAKWLISFGSRVTAAEGLNYSILNADKTIVGLGHSLSAVGFYSRAASLAIIPSSVLSYAATRSLYPRLAQAVSKPALFASIWCEYLKWSCLVSTAAATFMAFQAAPLLSVLLGAQWAGGASILAILALTIPVNVARALVPPAFQAHHRVQLLLSINTLGAVGVVGTLVLFRDTDLIVMAAVLVVGQSFSLMVSVSALIKCTSVTLASLSRAVLPAVALCILLSAALWTVSKVDVNDIVALVVSGGLTASMLGGASFLLQRMSPRRPRKREAEAVV